MAEGKTTISVIKADIGSIGGHIKPSQRLLDRVTEFVEQEGRDLITDSFISHTGDDIANLMAHNRGVAGRAMGFELGVSIGIALYPQHGSDTEGLIRLADRALYIA